MEKLSASEKAKRERARKELSRMQRELRAETRKSTIYATVYPKAAPPAHRKKDYPLTFGFKGAVQNEVENFMMIVGYGCSDYWLSHEPKDERFVYRVKINRFYKKNRKFRGISYSMGLGGWK